MEGCIVEQVGVGLYECFEYGGFKLNLLGCM